MNAVTPIQTIAPKTESPLKLGNTALRAGNLEEAIQLYLVALAAMPGFSNVIAPNLSAARQKYRATRDRADKPRVAVCGWELSHNAAGRVYTLAMMYETFADVEIIGSHFPRWGRDIWAPIRDTAIAKHSFVVEDESKFLEQAIQLVAAHPYDIVHLSKPRAPNIFFGILYKLIWDAKVLMDIDDEELAFVEAETPISVDDYLKQHGKLPDLKDLSGKDWTRLAAGLAQEFDGITVCNTPLQQRYGGDIIHHARDEKLFQSSTNFKRKSREKYGVPQEKKVVLSFGSPREQIGLLETAHAIASLNRTDIVFVIVGDFANAKPKIQLESVSGVRYIFLDNQVIGNRSSVLALADCCVLIQLDNKAISAFQTPGEMSDALAMQVPVIANITPPIKSACEFGALLPIGTNDLVQKIATAIDNVETIFQVKQAGQTFFNNELSFSSNVPRLKNIIDKKQYKETKDNINKIIEANDLLKQINYIYLPSQKTQKTSYIKAEKILKNEKFINKIKNEKKKEELIKNSNPEKIAVVAHFYYSDIWIEIAKRLKIISKKFDLFVTVPTEKLNEASSIVLNDFPNARIYSGPNLGMDIIPFLTLVPILDNEGYLAICKIQTKKGDGNLSVIWRDLMLDTLVGSGQNFNAAIDAFRQNESLCLLGPAALYLSSQRLMYDNADNISKLLQIIYKEELAEKEWGFFAGTMFWARVDILKKLAQHANFGHKDLDSEYKKDGKFEHALERLFGLLPHLHNGKIGLLQPKNGQHSNCEVVVCDTDTSISQAHVGDLMRQLERIDNDSNLIGKSGLFDSEYYLTQNPELKNLNIDLVYHYLTQGVYKNKVPNKRFTIDEEISLFLKEKGSTETPFIFYIQHEGDHEKIFSYIKANSIKCAIIYDIDFIRSKNLFDSEYYFIQNQKLSKGSKDPLVHYLEQGTFSEHYPNRYFIPREYRALHNDVVQANIEPFYHYLTSGAVEGRRYRSTKSREDDETPFFRYMVLNETLIDWRKIAAKQNDTKLVSIIIPIYDQPQFTRNCLTAILSAKTSLNFEVVCVDNGSGIEIKELLIEFVNRDKRIRVVSNRENYNFAVGCNIGFREALGSIIVFLNNDTTVTDDWLDELIKPLTDPKVAVVQPKLLYPDKTIQCIGVVFAPRQTLGYPIYAGLSQENLCTTFSRDFQAVTGACMAIRASDFAALKGFDPLFINGQEDVDLCLKLTHGTGRVCRYQSSSVVIHHESKTLGRGRHIKLNRQKFTERWLGKITPDDYKYYNDDKYRIVKWNRDHEDHIRLGIGISRPVLELTDNKILRLFYFRNICKEFNLETRINYLYLNNVNCYNNTLISVIMPTYNRAKIIKDAINSVISQSHRFFQLIIIDDGSTDNTHEVVDCYADDARIQFVKLNHVGVSGARNIGLDLAKGGLVAYLDSDNTWQPDFLRNMLVIMDQDKLDAAYSSIHVIDDESNTIYYRGDEFDWNECLVENYIDINAFVHTKTRSLNIRFDETLKRLVDWDFILHITKNARVGHLPYIGVNYYDGDTNQRISRTEYLGDQLASMQQVIRAKHQGDGRMPSDLNAMAAPQKKTIDFRIKIGCPNLGVSQEWGDYHFATALKRSFDKFGHSCEVDCLDKWESAESDNSDVIIVLRGLSRYKPKPHQFNFIWNISHPDKVTLDEFEEYDHVFVASARYAKVLVTKLKTPVSELLQCTDPVLFNTAAKKIETDACLFVGNSRNIFRKIVKDALNVGLPLVVYGSSWEQFIPRQHIKGEHIINSDLARYYAGAKVVLNDHWDTMREYGFLSNRLFDALACGSVVLSDKIDGMVEVFGEHVFTYTNASDLKDIISNIDKYVDRDKLLAFAKDIQLKHSFDVRVSTILHAVNNLLIVR
ncbi:MAG: glycosyltransferase [Cytophaga sp.]|nr:glycosyltransferase [Undibacterium sp.]